MNIKVAAFTVGAKSSNMANRSCYMVQSAGLFKKLFKKFCAFENPRERGDRAA